MAIFAPQALAQDKGCDDGIDCTTDERCDAEGNVIQRTFQHWRCDDANVCTANVCTLNGCRFDPLPVAELDDGNACTQDLCDSKEGIIHPPVAVDDRNVCTTDSCDPVTGVQHALIDSRIDTVCSEGVGACYSEGKWACDSKTGAVACSARAGAPREEVCNAIDDDCDGSMDDVARLGEACTDGEERCLLRGVLECKPDGQLACSVTAGDGTDERCDGIDNDCDGRTDEDLARGCYEGPSYAVGVGVCTEGRQSCESGEWSSCAGSVLPSGEEICGNALDDDCDGTAEEDCRAEEEPIVTADTSTAGDKTAPTVTNETTVKAEETTVKAAEPTVKTTSEPAKTTTEPVVVFQQPITATKTTSTTEKTLATTTTATKTADTTVKTMTTTTDSKTDSPVKTTSETTLVKESTTETVTKEPVTTVAEPEKTATEPPPAESPCRSTIFDCAGTIWVEPPFAVLDGAGVLYPSVSQEAALFDKQMLLAAGHSDAEAKLAYLSAREFAAGGEFTFHTCLLPEAWKHLEIAALNGAEKNDVIAVSESLRYVHLFDFDQALQNIGGKECALVPQPLFDFSKGTETQRGWEQDGSAYSGDLVDIYSLQAIPLSEASSWILGVVELEAQASGAGTEQKTGGVEFGVIYPTGTENVVSVTTDKTAQGTPAAARVLGLDLLVYFDGEIEPYFTALRELAADETIRAVRAQLKPGAEGSDPVIAVAVETSGGNEWYDCSLQGGFLSCTLNKFMGDVVPLTFVGNVLITSEGEPIWWQEYESAERERSMGTHEATSVPPEEKSVQALIVELQGKPAVAQMEREGLNVFVNIGEALGAFHLAEGSLQVLDERLAIGSGFVVSETCGPLAFMLNAFGGNDLCGCFDSDQGGVLIACYPNSNEPPQLELGSATEEGDQWLILVTAADEMGDLLACEANLKDAEQNDMSGCVVHADCEAVRIDKACLEGEGGSAAGKASLSVAGTATLSGEVTATDAGGAFASKSFSVSASGVSVAQGIETGVGPRAPLDDPNFYPAASAAVDQPTYGISGGGFGCQLNTTAGAAPCLVYLFFLIFVFGFFLTRLFGLNRLDQ